MTSHVSFLLRVVPSVDPSWILGCLGKGFQFSDCHHLHHEGIMESHILIVTEMADGVFLFGGAMEFLVGGV